MYSFLFRSCFQSVVEAFAGGPKRLIQSAFKDFTWWQLRQVLRDPDPAPFKLQQFHMLVRFTGTDKQTEWRLFPRLPFVLFQLTEVAFHLPFIRRSETAEFKVDGEQSTQAPMEEEQVQVVVLAIHGNSLLPSDKAEVRAEL